MSEGIISDNQIREENKANGHKLCKRCSGTGNELFSMYRRCEDCEGSGISERALKVFKMNDCDWWADVSMESACVNYCKDCGLDSDECLDSPKELTESELETHDFYINGDRDKFISFKAQLESVSEPQFFASTEY